VGEDELVVLDVAEVFHVAGEDADAVAALFGLAPVRVIDAHADPAVLKDRPEQDAVAAEAEVAVADQADDFFVEREVEFVWVEHEIVVAEPVVTFQ
jgi:hypothetical protein